MITITFDGLVKGVALLVSLAALLGLVWRTFKKIDETNNNRDEIEKIKAEQNVICFGLFACLDGLRQLGANGNVTKAYNALEKHITEQAHE